MSFTSDLLNSRRIFFKSALAAVASLGLAKTWSVCLSRKDVFIIESVYVDRNGGNFDHDNLNQTVAKWLDVISYERILSSYRKQGKILKVSKAISSSEFKTNIVFTSHKACREFYSEVGVLVNLQVLKEQNYLHLVSIKA